MTKHAIVGKAATTTTVAMEGKEKDQIAMIVIVGEEVKEKHVKLLEETPIESVEVRSPLTCAAQ